MITEEKKFVAEISECSNVIKMGIDIDSKIDMESILEILGDSMYSNKPLTLLREYSTNAYDAHIEAGIGNKPIEIFLPSPFIPELKIRDNGLGLSSDGIKRFASYGKSSKRDSNDVVGHLGVGCKSAFAYTDTFTITSIHQGEKSLYTATKDATGYKIYCLHTEPSDEPSGVEISIFVNPKDVSLFISNAYQCFKHFNPRPIFKNNNNIDSWIDSYLDSKLMDAGNWIVYNRQSDEQSPISLVMGNIIYPVRLENIELDSKISKFLDYWKSKSIVLFANIGDVSHASTRENLKYDDKTKQYLVDVLSNIPQQASELSQKFVSECSNLWEAKVLYHTMLSSKLGNGLLDVDYNGRKLSSIKDSLTIYKPSKSMKYNVYNSRWEQSTSVPAEENTVIFYAKGDITFSSVMIRLQSYRKSNSYSLNDHNTYIVFFKNPDSAQQFIDTDEFEGCTMVDLATVPYLKPNRKKNITNVPVGNVLEFQTGAFHRGTNSEYWKVAQDIPDTDTKYYIVISHYKPTDNPMSMIDLNNLSTDIKIISQSESKLYGVKKSEVSKLDNTWVNVTTYINDVYKELCKEQHLMNYLTHQFLWNHSSDYRFLCDLKRYKNQIPDNHPIRNFIESVTDVLYDSFQFTRVRRYINYGYAKDEILFEKQNSFVTDFFNKYFMLRHVTVCDDSVKDIIEYTKSG